MNFAVGSLVRARDREWVVLPESEPDLLVLRPLGGTDDEIAGIYLPLETVEPATFDLPDPEAAGDFRGGRLLRDALRLGLRSSAGPFRSFARIAVEPRPYQLVPLVMALRMDPVRLLIADDVGVGKTVEAGLIARELMDRGEIRRLCVLAPPHLVEQWAAELAEKFHIDAKPVLPGTVRALEAVCAVGESVFDHHDCLVVSIDFIKSDRRRDDFLRACPEFVIVDEAHTCAFGGEGAAGRHQRHALLKRLAENTDRGLVLVTATPHSGNEAAFRSLLGLLRPEFADLPEDLSGPGAEAHRRALARHFVQRRRGDIRRYMQADTPFPARETAEESYRLGEGYRALFDRVLAHAREAVAGDEPDAFRRRVRWWAALGLLRALASSPAAAAATLRSRAAAADAATPDEADAVGRRTVMDLTDEEAADAPDTTPGSDLGDDPEGTPSGGDAAVRRRLRDMARAADALMGAPDAKLGRAVALAKSLLAEGYHPIFFCRFIATAEYLAAELRARLPKGTAVEAVTGTLPPAERRARVAELAAAERRVLVATDCLSEGINLQESFNAVVHYDLSWNPTRHEQREGRVDRYGQPSPTVKTVTFWGSDNQIDGIVLDVLIRKHTSIRNSTGVSVPVPARTDQVIEAIFEGLLLRQSRAANPEQTALFDEEWVRPERSKLYGAWDASAEREKRSRTMFAQEGIKADEIARELEAARTAVGSGADVRRFVLEALSALGGVVGVGATTGGAATTGATAERILLDFAETPRALLDRIGDETIARTRRREVAFAPPVPEGAALLGRTHPLVEGLAGYIVDAALDAAGPGNPVACRCGAVRTNAVERRTVLLLLRHRYHIVTAREGREWPLLAEECRPAAFAGSPARAEWLPESDAERMLDAVSAANIGPEQARGFLRKLAEEFGAVLPGLEALARARGEELLAAHRRVRDAAGMKNVRYRVEPKLPVDVLGMYVLLPGE